MYLETRDIDETMDIYSTAWEKGLKSTYYLHMKPRHTAEQSTVRVNKAEKLGMIGFGAVSGNSRRKKPGFAAPLQKSLAIDTPEPVFKGAEPAVESPLSAKSPEQVPVKANHKAAAPETEDNP